jgi:hypothetical protein
MTNYGFVYLMANGAMPDIYKIGFTDRAPLRRCEELSSSTSIPQPFNIVCYIEVAEPSEIEKEIHQLYDEKRVSINREFFTFKFDYLINIVVPEFKTWGYNFTKCEYLEVLEYYNKPEAEKENLNG